MEEETKKGGVIAIDGPVAAGKGTLAMQLAKQLNGFYLYTGAMYRAVALLCLREGVKLEDKQAVINILPKLSFSIVGESVFLGEEDITDEIMNPPAANGSSVVSVIPEVRKFLVELQQKLAQEKQAAGEIVIAEGRDTANSVFPDADVKIFLTARPEVRAKRRMLQLQEKGQEVSYEQILKDLKERDERDQQRAISPLAIDPIAAGYIVLDDSDLSKADTVDLIIKEAQKKGL